MSFEAFAPFMGSPRDMPTILAVFVLGAAFAFGALWGSFLNVVIARVPKGISIVTPRSRCPSCSTQITAVDNIPILSWIILRAKCRACGAGISARYPFVEFLGGVAGAAAVARYGVGLPALELFCFTLILVAISFIDLDTFTVPEPLVIALGAVGLGFGVLRWQLLSPDVLGALTGQDVIDRVIGGVVAGAMLSAIVIVSTWFLRRRGRISNDETAMGWGDPMIFAGLGFCLGWQAMPLTLFLASIIGSIIGIALQMSGKLKDRGPVSEDDPWIPPDGAVPFGPFLALGGLMAAFFGDAIHQQLLPMVGLGDGGVLLDMFR